MMVGMTEPTGDQRDIRKVRIGLAIISVVVVIAVVALFLVDAAIGKAIMFAVAATAFVRAYGLVRWLRAADAGDPT
jgi:hypothetical protein